MTLGFAYASARTARHNRWVYPGVAAFLFALPTLSHASTAYGTWTGPDTGENWADDTNWSVDLGGVLTPGIVPDSNQLGLPTFAEINNAEIDTGPDFHVLHGLLGDNATLNLGNDLYVFNQIDNTIFNLQDGSDLILGANVTGNGTLSLEAVDPNAAKNTRLQFLDASNGLPGQAHFDTLHLSNPTNRIFFVNNRDSVGSTIHIADQFTAAGDIDLSVPLVAADTVSELRFTDSTYSTAAFNFPAGVINAPVESSADLTVIGDKWTLGENGSLKVNRGTLELNSLSYNQTLLNVPFDMSKIELDPSVKVTVQRPLTFTEYSDLIGQANEVTYRGRVVSYGNDFYSEPNYELPVITGIDLEGGTYTVDDLRLDELDGESRVLVTNGKIDLQGQTLDLTQLRADLGNFAFYDVEIEGSVHSDRYLKTGIFKNGTLSGDNVRVGQGVLHYIGTRRELVSQPIFQDYVINSDIDVYDLITLRGDIELNKTIGIGPGSEFYGSMLIDEPTVITGEGSIYIDSDWASPGALEGTIAVTADTVFGPDITLSFLGHSESDYSSYRFSALYAKDQTLEIQGKLLAKDYSYLRGATWITANELILSADIEADTVRVVLNANKVFLSNEATLSSNQGIDPFENTTDPRFRITGDLIVEDAYIDIEETTSNLDYYYGIPDVRYLEAASITGRFTWDPQDISADGMAWRVVQGDTYIDLIYQAILPGDMDGDGFVSQTDLDLVLLNWGTTFTDHQVGLGDLDGDNFVSQADLDLVLLHWSHGVAPDLSAIPEPGTCAAMLGLFTLATAGHRRAG